VPVGTAPGRWQALEHTCDSGESVSEPDGSGRGDGDPSVPDEDPSTSNSGEREVCDCGYCEGIEISYEEVDPHSGEAESHSFTRRSQKEVCPCCGGINYRWRQSFIAHCASVGKRLGRKRNVYFVSFALIRSAADEADLETEDSYGVLMDRWDRVRRQINRRADQADYHGVVAPRPSDQRFHGHLLIYTSLTRYELSRSFHAKGLDSYVQMPEDDGDSPERFAARTGAYVWENAASSSEARHVSSRGSGTGYNSREAQQRRREAVNGRDDGCGDDEPDGDGEPSTGAPSPNRNRRGGGGDGGHGGGDPGTGDPDPNRRKGWSRAPPVDCGGGCFPNLYAALTAAKAAFTRRVGTRVAVRDEGGARLLKVYRNGDSLMCVIAPDGCSTTARVPWNRVEVVSPPTIRPGSGGTRDRRNARHKNRDGSGNGGRGAGNGSGNGNSGPSSGDKNDGGTGSDSDGDGNGDGDDGDEEGKNSSGSDDDGSSSGSDGDGDGSNSSGKVDPSERFEEAADRSVVQTALPNRKRLKTAFDYRTGKAQATVLSPRYSSSG